MRQLSLNPAYKADEKVSQSVLFLFQHREVAVAVAAAAAVVTVTVMVMAMAMAWINDDGGHAPRRVWRGKLLEFVE